MGISHPVLALPLSGGANHIATIANYFRMLAVLYSHSSSLSSYCNRPLHLADVCDMKSEKPPVLTPMQLSIILVALRRRCPEDERIPGNSIGQIDEKKDLSENLLDGGTYPGPASEPERARLVLQGCMTLGEHHAKAVSKIIFGLSDSALLFDQASIKALTGCSEQPWSQPPLFEL